MRLQQLPSLVRFMTFCRDAAKPPPRGTGLSIFGGHRSNYGTYSISVDGQTISSGSSQSNDSSSRQLLGSASGLPYGNHTAVLTSTSGGPIDIDWVDFNARVGPQGYVNLVAFDSSLLTPHRSVGVKKTFDDNDSTIIYQPSAADWQSNSNPAFFDGTLRSVISFRTLLRPIPIMFLAFLRHQVLQLPLPSRETLSLSMGLHHPIMPI